MFKGKILALYFPDRYLNIFSKRWLDYFIEQLALLPKNGLESLTEIDERRVLMEFKQNDEMMKKMTTDEYAHFLRDSVGYPSNKNNSSASLQYFSLPDVEEAFKGSAFVNINLGFVEPRPIKIFDYDNLKKIDYLAKAQVNIKLGRRGENIVYQKEIDMLKCAGRQDLAARVRHVSAEDDSKGYDILSFEPDGREKYIEVKSTSNQLSDNTVFFMTSNEIAVAERYAQNYYIYIVSKVTSPSPQIAIVKDVFGQKDKFEKIPTQYKVRLNISLN
jgi:hypothetical protein